MLKTIGMIVEAGDALMGQEREVEAWIQSRGDELTRLPNKWKNVIFNRMGWNEMIRCQHQLHSKTKTEERKKIYTKLEDIYRKLTTVGEVDSSSSDEEWNAGKSDKFWQSKEKERADRQMQWMSKLVISDPNHRPTAELVQKEYTSKVEEVECSVATSDTSESESSVESTSTSISSITT